jgi:hypothetical protein
MRISGGNPRPTPDQPPGLSMAQSPGRSSTYPRPIPGGFLSPIPPARSNRALGLGGPARLRPLEGRGRQNTARHRHARVESHNPAIINSAARPCLSRRRQPSMSTATIARSAARVSQRVFLLAGYRRPPRSRTNPRPSCGLYAGSLFPCASRSLIGQHCPSHNRLWRNETRRCHHLSDDQKDIYARVSNHVFHSVEAVEREGQAIGETGDQAMRQSRFPRIEANEGGVGTPGGGRSVARPILDVLSQFRGRFSRNLAAFIPKILNPIKRLGDAKIRAAFRRKSWRR